jgi:uncharacterized protein YecE (DUF72 family)
MKAAGRVRIGISGWRYAGWRGVFYPPKLAQRRELEFAASRFETVEINGTFYSLQRPEYFREWALATPDDFIFAVKGSRYLTHMLKLRNAQQGLANLFASGVLELGLKMGPVLWQFAPQMKFDRARFTDFFELLPRTHGAASSLARLHDARLDGRASTEVARDVAADTPIRHAVEIRDESFAVTEFVEMLREHDVGLVVADTVAWPLLVDVTADFVYCRLHGSEELYVSGYGDEALNLWADRVVAWARGQQAVGRRACEQCAPEKPRDVYVYFDNDAKVHAPFDAEALRTKVAQRLGGVTDRRDTTAIASSGDITGGLGIRS